MEFRLSLCLGTDLRCSWRSLGADVKLCSGMTPLIRALLSNLIGEEDAKTIDIISNDVDVHPDGSWEIKFRHPTRSAHHWLFRSLISLLLTERGTFFFAADLVTTNHRQFCHIVICRTDRRCSSLVTEFQVNTYPHDIIISTVVIR